MKMIFRIEAFLVTCIAVLLSVCAYCQPITSQIVYLEQNTEVEIFIADGKLNGPYRLYDPHGVLSITGQFKDGKMDGQWVMYDSQGTKVLMVTYREGVREGQVQMWFTSFNDPEEAGKKKLDGVFANGVYHGMVLGLWPNGTKHSERIFTNGKLVTARVWDEYGREVPPSEAVRRAHYLTRIDEEFIRGTEQYINLSLRYSPRKKIDKD